jgi:hypothetical protein
MTHEEINTPKESNFLPPEAANLLLPLPNVNVMEIPTDPAGRERYLLATNVFFISKNFDTEKDVKDRPDLSGIRDLNTKHDPFGAIRVSDNHGQSEIFVFPRNMPKINQLMGASFKKPGTVERLRVDISIIPSSHWVLLAEAKTHLMSAERQRKSGSFIGRIANRKAKR